MAVFGEDDPGAIRLDWVGPGDLFKNNMYISVNYCLFLYYRLYYAKGWRIGANDE